MMAVYYSVYNQLKNRSILCLKNRGSFMPKKSLSVKSTALQAEEALLQSPLSLTNNNVKHKPLRESNP